MASCGQAVLRNLSPCAKGILHEALENKSPRHAPRAASHPPQAECHSLGGSTNQMRDFTDLKHGPIQNQDELCGRESSHKDADVDVSDQDAPQFGNTKGVSLAMGEAIEFVSARTAEEKEQAAEHAGAHVWNWAMGSEQNSTSTSSPTREEALLQHTAVLLTSQRSCLSNNSLANQPEVEAVPDAQQRGQEIQVLRQELAQVQSDLQELMSKIGDLSIHQSVDSGGDQRGDQYDDDWQQGGWRGNWQDQWQTQSCQWNSEQWHDPQVWSNTPTRARMPASRSPRR